MIQMKWNLIDDKDESYSPKHKKFFYQIHHFLNLNEVFLLNKLVVTGTINVPESIIFN